MIQINTDRTDDNEPATMEWWLKEFKEAVLKIGFGLCLECEHSFNGVDVNLCWGGTTQDDGTSGPDGWETTQASTRGECRALVALLIR